MADDLDRTKTINTERGDVELGVTDAIEKHYARHVVSRKAVSERKLEFERKRPRWLRECLAEATGVFFYVYPGIASVASFVLTINDEAKEPILPAFSSFFQIGLGFAIGIAFAIILCAPTSGGHFNPAITLCLAFWQGFPWKKVPHYIFSQIVGAFVASCMVYGQYHEQISALSKETVKEGLGNVYNVGPAGIFMALPGPEQTNLGYLFFIEFFVDSFIGLIIWACIDPANPFVSPTTIPWTIGLVYAVMVWGFAPITISTNLARDLGCRLAAAAFFGTEVFTYHNYSWIAILVNIPATFFATCYYEFVFRDSLQKLGKRAAVHEHGEHGLRQYLTNTGFLSEDEKVSAVNGTSMNGHVVKKD